ncbi:MAG: type II toxin-antitoxin system VapC family toxin [Verrucomicrobiota bacterium]
MALLNALQHKRVYLDANIFIYALEAYAPFVSELTGLFESLDRGEIFAVTSELTLVETLVKPLLDKNLVRQQAYEQAIQNSTGLEVIPVSREILREAARLRAETNIRLPDAIHLATALESSCNVFLTNDRKLKCPPEVELLHLSAMVS